MENNVDSLPTGRFHWCTLALLAAVYGAWGALMIFHGAIPWPLLAVLGGFTVCLYTSVQHETIHGHLTPWTGLNTALVSAPLTIWLPYGIYRDDHIEHHRTGNLADPAADPESFYFDPRTWNAMPRSLQALYRFNNTLLGRLVAGPLLIAGRSISDTVRKWPAMDGRRRMLVVAHWMLALGLLAALDRWAGLSAVAYIGLFAWPATSLVLMRSYLEHQSDPDPAHRTVIVEGGPLTRLLYLNNNYHVVHHALPGLPWYKLPGEWTLNQDRYLEINGGYRFRSYLEIARRYLIRAKAAPAYPLDRPL